ncbi:hypothetical protein [Fusobacterium vincentii ATCC 49256]|uniref:Lipoprotein n=1 Tax=Fusobacterium vincentii ATCC 49256 TaxID=209882 RepID=Q7P7J5_FUSVC|nr:hypothetical protein [Fusobacterium vincentii ATCC 49256]
MKKEILCIVIPILLITACTHSFGVGAGTRGRRSSVSTGTGISTGTKTKKIDDNIMKEKAKTTAKKPTPKKVVGQNTIKNNKTEATGNTNKTGTTVKRVKQERQE